MSGPEQAPTQAAVMELREERAVVSEAYDFLDEKRLLLAAEILRQLETYDQLSGQVAAIATDAARSLRAAAGRHGLQGLSVYPAASLENAAVGMHTRNFMGVTLAETDIQLATSINDNTATACNPSSEAEQCRASFLELLKLNAVLAGVSGNLYRLSREYRVTERRARALENVILPEIEQSMRIMTGHLEELVFEDIIRVHLQARD
jgi:V/A-type H+-transporting ATPase subunit D